MTPMQQIFLGMGAVAKKTYVDDVFSTYVYAGTGSATSINNGLNLSGEGGMAWMKKRTATSNHQLVDTVRGATKYVRADTSTAEQTNTSGLTAFNNNGFTLGNSSQYNGSGSDYASWSFRKAPGFFDVVTYTGNGTAGRTVNHSLGSVPGFIMIKRLDGTDGWIVSHRNSWSKISQLTNAAFFTGGQFHYTTPTSTQFTLGDGNAENANGGSYVAYVFAGGESTAATARSVDFDGNDDLTLAASTDLDFGTGDFTVEFWYKGGSYTASSDRQVIIAANKTWGAGFHQIRISDVDSAHRNRIVIWDYDTDSSDPIFVSSKLYLPHVWRHVAVTRTGGKLYVYVNGTLDKSISYTAAFNLSGGSGTMIGYNPANTGFVGELSNLRVVKGTAVYTSSFRPPTEPLTNITNTKLLCCNNSSTTGSTVTPGTITANGDPTASTDSPFDDPAGFKFGDSGTENVIKCGSYTADSDYDVWSNTTIELGWEPSFVMYKNASNTGNWEMFDTMRGFLATADDSAMLEANTTDAEEAAVRITMKPTGFQARGNISTGDTVIYVAIRRPDGYVGKPVELGTSVFAMDSAASDEATIPNFDSGFPVDFAISRRPASADSWMVGNRLMGTKFLYAENTDEEATESDLVWDSNAGIYKDWPTTHMAWMWKRHKGFDIQRYTGKTGQQSRVHGLNAVPEMIWAKSTNNAYEWAIGHKDLTGGWTSKHLRFTSSAEITGQQFALAPTSTHWTTPNGALVNDNGEEYIAMLFASVDGISKVGSYTGTGNALSVTTGFQPRFLFIKNASNGTGDSHWWVVDTTRGWASGDDNCLRLDTTNAATTGANLGAPTSTGFDMPANVGNSTAYNKSGDTYIYYAHA